MQNKKRGSGIWSRIGGTLLIALGFFLVLFSTSTRTFKNFGAHDDGNIAHADAPAGSAAGSTSSGGDSVSSGDSGGGQGSSDSGSDSGGCGDSGGDSGGGDSGSGGK